ncbi:MAG TPA: transcription elongation factor GreA [Candidatus Evtepia faecigallinarum]|nr:transcription elongation factor GreA [Candidatus Evtepia faecigallinarum]
MHDELTQVDIDKMKEELQHRIQVLRPQLIEEVKVARSFGDLSENFEYKAAKREKNRNDSRIRYLQNMIKTAVVIDPAAAGGGIALFDKVTFYVEDDDAEETIQLVTTLRQDALKGLISKESPVGKALLGRKEGDRVRIQVSDSFGYYVQIRKVEKTGEDPDIPISTF